ncbi:AAA family ATPase [Sphingobium subterraneum]|uniref:DNA polymerase-3 subunit delta n=1 Tax=Sphingobium subterraneum TaxID=627688 RepID=A0A841J1P5_9SPHN|nr:AAA family ATPase [Sphingobium subterraneum]MBB6122575.1 DNA polymerase-3 subunit delta' [Sphingobium subterraneum]
MTSFSRILGHDLQRAELLDAAASGRMHHGWILAGSEGIGKASVARSIALSLLAGEAGEVPDHHPAAHLFTAGTHPDYAELSRVEKDNGDLARNISVDQVRGLHRLLESAPSIASRRVILIDSADDLERGAANALLKSLEEPPQGVVFLLVSHAPSRLLPTIRSRCRMLRFSALDESTMRRALADARPDLPDHELAGLIEIGNGSPGRALGFAGLGIAEMNAALARIAATGDPDNAERLTLAQSLALKSARLRFVAFLEHAPAFIAAQARARHGDALATSLAAWDEARRLAGGAILLSLDPATVVFELCSQVASLARQTAEV